MHAHLPHYWAAFSLMVEKQQRVKIEPWHTSKQSHQSVLAVVFTNTHLQWATATKPVSLTDVLDETVEKMFIDSWPLNSFKNIPCDKISMQNGLLLCNKAQEKLKKSLCDWLLAKLTAFFPMEYNFCLNEWLTDKLWIFSLGHFNRHFLQNQWNESLTSRKMTFKWRWEF